MSKPDDPHRRKPDRRITGAGRAEKPSRRAGATPPDGTPKVVYLSLPDESLLPPDAWFQDAEGEAEMRRETLRREAALRRR